MASIDDVRGTKAARSAFGKHGIDLTMADVRVQHGVCFVRGQLKALPKWRMPSVEHEAERTASLLKRTPEIKEVVLECTYREDHFNDESGGTHKIGKHGH
ncbi:MAG: hypothetical protein JSS72_09930 [Armatimonadetes bacterium]|nr:hypothetical protein [Armatimonadota bacterium]